MSTTNQESEQNNKLALTKLIVQFLRNDLQTNTNLNATQKESLEVAVDCIEQAYLIGSQEASNKLLEVYTNSLSNRNTPSIADLVPMLQQIAPSLLPTLTPLMQQFTGAGSVHTNQNQTPPTAESATSNSVPRQNTEPPRPKRQLTEEEKKRAEDLKNQGNDLMKNEQYQQAYDAYTEAIKIDNNNAVYYSNRAAASSKLNDHHAALRDCEEAIRIDPTYSKAYGRQGLAYVHLNDHAKARDAYKEAVKYDPNNESYRNNLALATQKAEESSAGGAANPMMDLLNRVTQGGTFDEWMNNPQMQNAYQMFCNIVSQNNPNNQHQQQPPPGTS